MAYGPAQAYPPLPGVPVGGTGGSVPWMNPDWLAASADRERAIGILRAAFAEGRLSQDELDDRVGRTYAARTYGELWALTSDLPAGPYAPSNGPVALLREKSPSPASWRPAAALIITALVIFTLAALITAIVTKQPQPGFQQVTVVPVPNQVVIVPPAEQQPAILTPYVIPVFVGPPSGP